MKDILNTILKLLGIVIALLVIMTIFVLLLRTATPVQPIPQVTETAQQQSWLYNPLWDWYYYPYYWFYPREKHHHYYHDDKKPHHPPPAPAPSPAPSSGLPPTPLPSSGSTPVLDILPEITISNSLSGGISVPVQPIQPLEPIVQSIQPAPEPVVVQPPPAPETVVAQPFDNIAEAFTNFNGDVPEPWSLIKSLPEVCQITP
jgi:hypothetical protein